MARCGFLIPRTGRPCRLPGVHDGRCRHHRDTPIQAAVAEEEEAVPNPECCVCYEGGDVQTLECTHQICTTCLDRLPRRLCPMCRAHLPDYDAERDRRNRLEMVLGAEELAARERREVQARRIRRWIKRFARDASTRETLTLLGDISRLTQHIVARLQAAQRQVHA